MRLDVPLERYRMAVMDNPRGPKEGAIAYVARIAELAAGIHAASPLKPMPEARLPYKDSE